ncbi:MAG TPA: CAP domain-containing protein [Spirochaetes bacterium]|nr:CAP domain-containing protein [Spirochaetota bacterium]
MGKTKFSGRIIIAAVMAVCVTAVGGAFSQEDLQEAIRLNDAEKRLSDYKDNETTLKMKLEVLDTINANRARHGIKPVKLDILASRVASMTSSEAAKGNFRGHWNLRGEKPYHRFAFAGGVDHVTENASMVWSSAPLTKNYEAVKNYMLQMHTRMYNETPPNDGHRKNILDPWHTHVGLGFSMINNNFRYYEHFINRYLEFSHVDRAVRSGNDAKISGRVAAPGFGVYMVVVFYEPFPEPMTVMEVNSKGSYPDFTNTRSQIMNFADTPSLNDEGKFSRNVKTTRKGLYYVQIYLRQGTPGGWNFVSTRGLPSVSGVVIRAE